MASPLHAPARDEALLGRLQAGDDLAFDELLERLRPDVMAVACSILRHREDAEDACQQVFLRLYERSRQYRGDAPVRVWLRRLTVSTCIDILRRRRVRAFLCPWQPRADEKPLPYHLDPDGLLSYAELRRRVDAALGTLPSRQRAIFSLRVFEEWSLAEIACSLGVEIGTVKTHLHRAVQRVREKLEPVEAQPGVPALEVQPS